MSGWIQRTLLEVSPATEQGLSFFYLPLTGEQQESYRAQAKENGAIPNVTWALFCARTLMFRVTSEDKGTKYFTWPEDPKEQHLILSKIPEEMVIEMGLVILGFAKNPDEDPYQFMRRILRELQGR